MFVLRRKWTAVFRAPCALDRGFLKSKKEGKLSIQYNGDLSNAELLFRTFNFRGPVHCLRRSRVGVKKIAQQILDGSFFSTEKLVANMTKQFDC